MNIKSKANDEISFVLELGGWGFVGWVWVVGVKGGEYKNHFREEGSCTYNHGYTVHVFFYKKPVNTLGNIGYFTIFTSVYNHPRK